MPSRRPWLRLYTSFRTDPRVQCLSVHDRAAAINLLCLAGEMDVQGHIQMAPGVPYSDRQLAVALNVDRRAIVSTMQRLCTAGVFGCTKLADGTHQLCKWAASQPQDPDADVRKMRQRVALHRLIEERDMVTNVTAESRVEKSRVEKSTPLLVPPTPDAETAVSSPAPKKSRKPVTPSVGLDFEERMLTRFPNLSPSLIHDQTMLALAHQSATKYANTELYIQNWLRREAERVQGNSNRLNGQARYGPSGEWPSPAHIPRSEHSVAAARAAGAPLGGYDDDMP